MKWQGSKGMTRDPVIIISVAVVSILVWWLIFGHWIALALATWRRRGIVSDHKDFMRDVTPAWEDVETWGTPTTAVERIAITELRQQQEVMADRPDGMPSCIIYDEEITARAIRASAVPNGLGALRETVVLKDTDAFARQGDKGPYHWAQGPQDLTPVTTPPPPPSPVEPSPNPEPVKPGQLPRKGKAVTTTHLRLRRRAGTGQSPLGVLPTGTVVELTGGRKRIKRGKDKDLWVRICVETVVSQDTELPSEDRWLIVPPGVCGWVDSDFLAIPASEYEVSDFPPVTHEFRWFLDDSGGLDRDTVRTALTAIAQDPRGPLRAGVMFNEAKSADTAHILVRMVDNACSGAAGCYYKRMGERARVDIAKEWFNKSWLSRVWLHEAFGHACSRAYDHYRNAPQYPRDDYYGLMGNWQDHYGDHAWPDADDIENIRQWVDGKSDVVFVQDLGDKA